MPQQFLSIGFEVEGVKQTSVAFDLYGKNLNDFRVPLEKSKDILMKAFQLNFETEGKTLGKPWAALSPKYALMKNQRFPGRKILQKTGKMKTSFSSIVTSVSATMFNTADYFGYHQSRAPRKRLKRRIMMRIDQTRNKAIFMEFTKFLNVAANHFEK